LLPSYGYVTYHLEWSPAMDFLTQNCKSDATVHKGEDWLWNKKADFAGKEWVTTSRDLR